jgi:hypothetical protein
MFNALKVQSYSTCFLITIFVLFGCGKTNENKSIDSRKNISSEEIKIVNNNDLNLNAKNLGCKISNIKSFPFNERIQIREYEITYEIYNKSSQGGRYILLSQNIFDNHNRVVSGLDSEKIDADILDLKSELKSNKKTELKRLWKNQKQWSRVVLNSCRLSNDGLFSQDLNHLSNKISKNDTFLNAVFSKTLAQLKKTVNIRIRLPSSIPIDIDRKIYSIIEVSNPSKYKVMLAFTESCNGGNACRIGTLSGEDVSQNYIPKGKLVPLSDGRSGYFVDSHCGANCSDAKLIWEQEGVRYIFALKAGRLENLLNMANSSRSY